MATMNASDAVLWAIERDPKLRSTVTAVALLDRAPDIDLLRSRIGAAVRAFPRLRQKVAEPPLGVGRPRWIVAPGFDLDRHLKCADGGGQDRSWLLDRASATAEAGVDRRHPLWEIEVVTGLHGEQAALIEKFHHSLTDGIGGIELVLALLDWSRRPRRQPELAPVEDDDDAGGGPLAALGEQVSDATRALTALPPYFLHSLTHPGEAVADSWRTSGSVGRLLAPAMRPLSPVFGERSTSWHFDIHEESMDALHSAASAVGGTVNDVFLAAVAGCLHRYHVKFGRPVPGLRINLPVSSRKAGDAFGGNRFTPVRFVLPVDELDPARRVRQLGALCRRWRSEPALPLTDTIADVLSRLPDQATTAVMGSMMQGVDFVATNVPGVPKRCYIAGAEVTRQYAFAPLAGAAVNFALVSHAGTACIGVNTDRLAVTDPDLLMGCLHDAFAEVLALGC